MKYFLYTFSLVPGSTDAADLLSALLAEIGFESFMPSDDGQTLQGWVQQTVCSPDDINNCTAQLYDIMNVSASWQCSEPEHRDWNERWEQESFQPISIDNKIYIHAPWQAPSDDQLNIVISPRMAFGTGTHATTYMLLHLLSGLNLNGKRVIDAGCGTGVLGIYCLERGAESLLAYDIDHWSVDNTIQNLSLNNRTAIVLEGDAGVLQGHHGYNICMANINRNILLSEVPRILPSLEQGALIITSGYYVDDAAVLIDRFASAGLKVMRKEEKDGWCAIIFEKTL